MAINEMVIRRAGTLVEAISKIPAELEMNVRGERSKDDQFGRLWASSVWKRGMLGMLGMLRMLEVWEA